MRPVSKRKLSNKNQQRPFLSLSLETPCRCSQQQSYIFFPPLKFLPGNDPCSPYPCGPNTDCMVSPLGVAVCRCKAGFFPKPDTITGCGPQCTHDDECSSSQNCAAGRCVNICEDGICGVNALCEPRNRRAICRCPSGYSGDPFTRCVIQQSTGKLFITHNKTKDLLFSFP